MNDAARPPILPWIVAIVAVAGLGAYLVRDAVGLSTVAWMNIYRVEDFADTQAILDFFAELRIAIPPVLAAIEFLNHQIAGGTAWVTVHLYRACLVAGYALAIAFTYPSYGRLAFSTGLSALFLWATTLIHPAGPNVYDAVYPVLILTFLLALRCIGASATMALVAGTALALAELTRPFVLVLLPLFLLASLLRARSTGRVVAFLLPVLLLSGLWHLHQYASHGQVLWSNHGGFNLQRAWPMVATPPLVPESTPARIAPDRLVNFNTPEHAENSRRMQRAILDHVLGNPGASVVHAMERIAQVVAGEVRLHGAVPEGPAIAAYRVIVKFPALWMFAASAILFLGFLRRPANLGKILSDPGNVLILTTAATLVITALTEAGEEARFMIALLPFLAAVPVPSWRFAARPVVRTQGWPVAVAAVLAMLAIELFAQGALRRSAGEALGTGPDLPTTESPATLRVGQLHVRGGRWKGRDQAARSIARCLQGLDLVGLNGVSGTRLLSRLPDQAEALARVTGTASIFAPTERRWGSDSYGNALLTRRSIQQWRREVVASPRTPPKRNTLTAETAFAGTTLRVIVTQVDSGYDRDDQLAEVIRRFRALPEPALLMGELNATPELPAMRDLLAGDRVRFATVTMPTGTGPRTVDWIVARGLYVSPPSPCDTGVSDHPALVVEIKPLS